MYYVARDQKWGDTEIGTESGEITWGSNLDSSLQFDDDRYDAEDFQSALQDSFDAWEEISGLDFTYVGSGDADIDVVMGYGNGARFGTVGTASWNGGSEITSSTITFDDQEIWAPTGSGGIDFYAVALHEIGHAIGLNHYSSTGDDPKQIMNPSISADDLQSGDIAGAVYLYGTGGIIAPPPPPPPPPEEPEEPPEVPSPPPPPPEEPEAPPAPEAEPSDDGGSSGGAVGILVALLGVVAAMLFGGGAALAGLAAGTVSRTDENDPETGEDTSVADEVLLTDLLPVVEDMSHSVYVDDLGNFIEDPSHDHESGCDCGHCCGADEDMFFA